MFKKIVSNLPFSPALVGQLGFYAKRLRKEEATRRLTLMFVALTIVVQSMVVFQPSISANATNLPELPKCIVNSQSLVSDPLCSPNITKSKTSVNTSQGYVNASTVTANASDQISYTIAITNSGSVSTSAKLEDNLLDVLDYATLIDNGGGTLDTKGVLSWPDITLSPNDTQTRTFVVRLLSSIPSTAQSTNNPASYDCILTNTFGNSTNINVSCPTPKIIEKVATELPKAGSTENMLFACIVLAIAAYFYARTRQLEKEIHLVRKNTNVGTL